MSQAECLEELWINMNVLNDLEHTIEVLSKLHKLKTVYIADNPMVKGVSYLEIIKERLPKVE